MQNRFKSPVFWAAIIAQVLTIFVLTGVIGSETSEAINNVVAAVLQALVVLGVLNNPTNKAGL